RDWSSDVCSSDLLVPADGAPAVLRRAPRRVGEAAAAVPAIEQLPRGGVLRPRGGLGAGLGHHRQLLQLSSSDSIAPTQPSGRTSTRTPSVAAYAACACPSTSSRCGPSTRVPGRTTVAVLRAVSHAALVNDEFAQQVAVFGAGQRADVADHVADFAERGLRLPSTADAGLAMMFLLAQSLLTAVEEGSVELTDEQAVEGLTRFVYRGLTGRDY